VSGPSPDDLTKLAIRLADCLAKHQLRLVLAESCTCGLAAATLGIISGISNHFCGSAVTYRDATKISWLEVEPSTIQSQTAVCADVAGMMASGVLAKTHEADLAASITGHLGPDAPAALDGLVYVGIADRTVQKVFTTKLISQGRDNRQREATLFLFSKTLEHLSPNED
jgi:nicotinamide-nucleotide amidase